MACNFDRNFWRRWVRCLAWAVPLGLLCFWLLKVLYCWFAEAGGFTVVWDVYIRLKDAVQ